MEKIDKTILYVDDEIVNLKLFNANFDKYFNVITASSATEGIELIKRNKIDLLITDFKMPVMNGIDFIKEIKKAYPDLRCIILSGYVDSQVISEKEHQLILDYIVKPWRKEGILQVVEKALSA